MSFDDSHHGGEEVLVRPPGHPVPSLQGPFEESMVESVNDATEYDTPMDALTRRTLLLDSAFYQRIVAGRWRQKPGEKYHPLWKLVAQMSFGIHLLARNMAKSEDEVMKILQAHVDDIDSFLERTSEDFDLAQSDMHERLRCLKLPLQYGEVFDRMLEDGNFRVSILEGNEKIEHIVHRTRRFLKDSMKDVQKGFDATNVLEKYLQGLARTWQRLVPEHEAVYVAMIGNAEGWRKAFMELHLQGNKLAGTLKKLTEVVNEMARRTAVASRNVIARSRLMSTAQNQSISSRSQLGSTRGSQLHKPLPSAPVPEESSRRSSKSIRHLDDSSRPTSATRSGQTRSSGSSPRSHGSPEPPDARRTPTPLSTTLLGSDTTSRIGTPMKGLGPPFNAEERTASQEDIDPIELPADVPEEVMRNAPVSIRNRLSYTLGLKPKENSDHRISSVYYPKALGALLKVPQSPQHAISPLSPASRAITVNSRSPHTGSEGDYFSAREQSPSIGRVAPDPKQGMASPAPAQEGVMQRTNVRSPVLVQDTTQRQSSMPILSPGLTSHPSVMAMAAPPAELPALDGPVGPQSEARPHSRSRNPSESTLGEPGPEITETSFESDIVRHEDVEIFFLPPMQQTSAPVHIPVTEEQSAVADPVAKSSPTIPEEAVVHELATGHEISVAAENLGTGAGVPQNQNAVDWHSDEANEKDSGQPQTSTNAGQILGKGLAPQPAESSESSESAADVVAQRNEATTKTIIAELEAIVPQTPSTKAPVSPIELEAPLQHFRLPPRVGTTTKAFSTDPSATIKHRGDFFKLPSEPEVKPGMKPKDYGRSSRQPEPIRPLKLKLTKLDGKMVPVQVHTPSTSQPAKPQASTLNVDVITNMIEQISTTPIGSPAHERSSSTASSNSAQLRSERTSRQFGPPESAPAPPPPGGRPMVSPDYAAAAEFQGERKQAKRSIGGSRGGLKDLLNAGSRRNSSEVSSKSLEQDSTRQSASARGSGSDMLTSGGKDVLWFKGAPGDGNAPAGVA